MAATDPRVSMIGLPAPAWLNSYADLMMQILCFFLILYVFTAVKNRDLERARKNLEGFFPATLGVSTGLESQKGILVSLQESPDRVYFASGSDALEPAMRLALQRLAPTLRMLAAQGYEIMVEGHTDNVAVSARRPFSSNWELSTARAANVVRYLAEELSVPLWSISSSGYGENHPLVANDTAANRAMNRRVVFRVQKTVYPPHPVAFQEPAFPR